MLGIELMIRNHAPPKSLTNLIRHAKILSVIKRHLPGLGTGIFFEKEQTMAKVTGTDLKPATTEQLVTLSSTIALELVKGLARAKVPFAQAQTWATNKSMPQRAARKIAQELGCEIFVPGLP